MCLIGRDELIGMLEVLLASRLAFGMEVTVFDPDLDPDGKVASAFADDLVAALADERLLVSVLP
jgi:arginase